MALKRRQIFDHETPWFEKSQVKPYFNDFSIIREWSILDFINYQKKNFSENKTNLYSFFYNPFLDFFDRDHFKQNFHLLNSFSKACLVSEPSFDDFFQKSSKDASDFRLQKSSILSKPRERFKNSGDSIPEANFLGPEENSFSSYLLNNNHQNNTMEYNKEYEMENFANLNQQISQIHLTLTLEGIFKKNKILIEIKNKPNFLIQHKKNSFILPIPLSYKKGIVNKEIPTILPPITSLSNFSFPFLSKTQLWNSLYSKWFLKYASIIGLSQQLIKKPLKINRKKKILYFLRSIFISQNHLAKQKSGLQTDGVCFTTFFFKTKNAALADHFYLSSLFKIGLYLQMIRLKVESLANLEKGGSDNFQLS